MWVVFYYVVLLIGEEKAIKMVQYFHLIDGHFKSEVSNYE